MKTAAREFTLNHHEEVKENYRPLRSDSGYDVVMLPFMNKKVYPFFIVSDRVLVF